MGWLDNWLGKKNQTSDPNRSSGAPEGYTPPTDINASGKARFDTPLFQDWPHLDSKIGDAATRDYERTLETFERNQQLAKSQADKYIAESKGAREGAMDRLEQGRASDEQWLQNTIEQAGRTRQGMYAAGAEAAQTMAGVASWVWEQAQAKYGNAAQAILQAKDMSDQVYKDANSRFDQLEAMRKESLATTRADIEKTLNEHSANVAQTVSMATTQLQKAEDQQIQAVMQEAKRNNLSMNDPTVKQQIREIRQGNWDQRTALATNSFNEANTFKTTAAIQAYTELGNQSTAWGQTMAAAAGTLADVGKALMDTYNIGANQMVELTGQMMETLGKVGDLRQAGETLKQNYYMAGEELATGMENNALAQRTAMSHNYNQARAQLEVIGANMRDAEYEAFANAYAEYVFPTFPMTATLWQMSTAEDQRKFDNFLSAVDAVMGVLSFAFPGRFGGGSSGGGGSSSGAAYGTAAIGAAGVLGGAVIGGLFGGAAPATAATNTNPALSPTGAALVP